MKMNNMVDNNTITLKNDTEIIVAIYRSAEAGSFKKLLNVKWSRLLERLSKPIIDINDKDKRGLAVYGQVKSGYDKNGKKRKAYRNNENVINRSVIALDYDDLTPQDEFIETVHSVMGNVSYCIYSSYNHTKEAPRYRLLIPLQAPTIMDSIIYREAVIAITDKIGLPYDKHSKTISQGMYLPVVKSENSEYIFTYNDGNIITLDDIIDVEAIKQKRAKGYKRYEANGNHDLWVEISNGISEGGRNTGLTKLAGLLFQKRLPDRLIYTLLIAYNEIFCSPSLSENEVLNVYTSIFKTHYHTKNMEAD